MATLGRSPGAAPLTSADIPDDSITAAKIVAATIAAGDLAPNSVDSSELVDGSIDTSHIGDNQVTLAKMAGGTDGQIITYDASGDPLAVGPGTDGQVLTSTGAGSPPAFEAVPSSSPNYDTDFPFTSLTQNFGKMRIIVGSGTAAASSSYFAASGLYYNLFTVTYSGFSDTPKIFMTIGGGSHETGVGAYYQVSTTSSNIYLNSRVSSQVISQAVYYVLIGTAS